MPQRSYVVAVVLTRLRVPEVLVAAFAVLDLVAGLTGAWNGPQPMIGGLAPSRVHSVISASIFASDIAITTSALLLVVSSWRGTGHGPIRTSWLQHIPWAAALVVAALTWVELWYAATHHPLYVNGGPVASSVFLAYVFWRIPFPQEDGVSVRLLAVAVGTTLQMWFLGYVEESWRIWH